MAAADIGVMVLYFSILQAVKHWSSKFATTSSSSSSPKTAAASESSVTKDLAIDSHSNDSVTFH